MTPVKMFLSEVLLIFLMFQGAMSDSGDGEDTVCTSHVCRERARSIHRLMDPSADPCQDFNQYACGNFKYVNPIPEGEQSAGTFNNMVKESFTKVRDILAGPPEPDEPNAVTKARVYYKSCIDADVNSTDWREPLLQYAADHFGAWPTVMPNWNPEFTDQAELIARAMKLEIKTLFYAEPWMDLSQVSTYELQLMFRPGESLIEDGAWYIHNDTEKIEELKAVIVEEAVMLGADPDVARRDAEDVVNLDEAIVRIRNEENWGLEKMRLGDMSHNISSDFNWMGFGMELVGNTEHLDVDYGTEVKVLNPETLKKLMKLWSATPERTRVNYLMLIIMTDLIKFLPGAPKKLVPTKLEASFGNAAWEKCMLSTEKVFQHALGRIYVDNYFSKEKREEARQLIGYIKATFRKQIEDATWLDEATRQASVEKLDEVVTMIGYVDELLDDDALDEGYSEFEPTDDFFYNSLMGKGTRYRFILSFASSTNHKKWRDYVGTHAAKINAFYAMTHNLMWVPAAIINGLYNKDLPMAMNIGRLGSVTGHELGHGFDIKGRLFNKYGDKQRGWWPEESHRLYEERAECFENQYSSYFVPAVNMTVNGKQTLGENIADAAAARTVFRAYRTWKEANGGSQTLPMLGVTDEQLMFLSYAQVWCSEYKPEGWRKKILHNVHSPGKFRILGPYSNSEDFARVFQCKEGDGMVPEERCVIW